MKLTRPWSSQDRERENYKTRLILIDFLRTFRMISIGQFEKLKYPCDLINTSTYWQKHASFV